MQIDRLTSLRALFSQTSIFLTGIDHLPLIERSKSKESGSIRGRFSVGKYWFWLLYDLVGANDETKC